MKLHVPLILKPPPGDFMPILLGTIVLLFSIPAFAMVYLLPDQGAGPVATLLLVLLGLAAAFGIALIVAGVRVCADPGSLTYRLVHPHLLLRPRRRART